MKRLIFSFLLFFSSSWAMQPQETLLMKALTYTYQNPMTVLKGAASGAVVIAGVVYLPIPAALAALEAASNPQISQIIEKSVKGK